MRYYKVLAKYDNCKVVNNGKYTGFLVGNELYTEKERQKLNVPDNVFEIIEVSKNKTYWFFGARFCGV